MIQIIAGREGAGKTKNLIDMANDLTKVTDGHIVYVDADNSHIYHLSHQIRLIKPDEYPLESTSEVFGFVCGILSQDYDIATVFIDGLLKNAKVNPDKVDALLHKVDMVATRYNVNFVISMCCAPEELPDSVQQYLVS